MELAYMNGVMDNSPMALALMSQQRKTWMRTHEDRWWQPGGCEPGYSATIRLEDV